METKIITGLSALFYLKFIKDKPKKEQWQVKNKKYFKNEKNKIIYSDNVENFEVGKIKLNNESYYCAERIYIELEKFSSDKKIYTQLISTLEKNINPYKVLDIYHKLKDSVSNINHKRIERYLIEKLIDIKSSLFDKNNIDKSFVILEYLMALLAIRNIPTCIMKPYHLYIYYDYKKENHNNAIDVLKLESLINYLENKNNLVYFKFLKKDEKINKVYHHNKHTIYFEIEHLTNDEKHEINELLIYEDNIKITIYSLYSKKDLANIIEAYKLKKTKLNTISNVETIIFSKELLVAEKIESLISKKNIKSNAQDLIDLYILYNENWSKIDMEIVAKYIFSNWENNFSNLINHYNRFLYIKYNNKIDELKLYKEFQKIITQKKLNIKFIYCVNIYKELINLIICFSNLKIN